MINKSTQSLLIEFIRFPQHVLNLISGLLLKFLYFVNCITIDLQGIFIFYIIGNFIIILNVIICKLKLLYINLVKGLSNIFSLLRYSITDSRSV
jgi:hypothetical protein